MESPNKNLFNTGDRNNQTLISLNNEKKIDQQMLSQIESLIQQQFQISVPAIIFEYRPTNSNSKEFSGWDNDDLYEFFSHFGDIEMLEIYGKLSIILFKTFMDAYTSREFLMNSSNFKETEKNNFIVRWYTPEDECFISDIMRTKFKKYTPSQVVEQLSTDNLNMNNSSNYGQNNNYMNYMNYQQPSYNNNDYVSSTNFNGQYNYYASWSLNPNARAEFNTILNSSNMQNNSGYRSNYWYEEDKSFNADKYLLNGKYTCKFEIQIENDNEFQVARRLIGAKGCNMKKIVDLCSRGPDGKFLPDAVKLRLRGRGSGYKEGPYNRESDEPLHLCISSKFFDKYKRACSLVQELIINVYEEYKHFCERNGRIPLSNLTIHKEEGVSTRKSNNVPNMSTTVLRDNIIVDN